MKNKNKKGIQRKTLIFNILAIICIILFCIGISPVTMQNDTYYTMKDGMFARVAESTYGALRVLCGSHRSSPVRSRCCSWASVSPCMGTGRRHISGARPVPD